jgi:hypothetical protein
MSYGTLEPGLQVAIDLLRREAINCESAGEKVDADAYHKAIGLLSQQRDVLRGLNVLTPSQKAMVAAQIMTPEAPDVDRG